MMVDRCPGCSNPINLPNVVTGASLARCGSCNFGPRSVVTAKVADSNLDAQTRLLKIAVGDWHSMGAYGYMHPNLFFRLLPCSTGLLHQGAMPCHCDTKSRSEFEALNECGPYKCTARIILQFLSEDQAVAKPNMHRWSAVSFLPAPLMISLVHRNLPTPWG